MLLGGGDLFARGLQIDAGACVCIAVVTRGEASVSFVRGGDVFVESGDLAGDFGDERFACGQRGGERGGGEMILVTGGGLIAFGVRRAQTLVERGE